LLWWTRRYLNNYIIFTTFYSILRRYHYCYYFAGRRKPPLFTFHTARRVILLFVYLSEIRKRDKTLWKTPVRTAAVSCAVRGSRDVRSLLPHGTPGLLGYMRPCAWNTHTTRIVDDSRLAVAEDNFKLAAAAAHVSPPSPSRSRLQRSRPVRAMLWHCSARARYKIIKKS